MQFEKITKRVEALCKVLREEALANHHAGTVLPRTLEALRKSGILTCNVPESAGGWGLGVANDRAEEYWRVIRSVAFADTSLSQVFQVHSNATDLIHAIAGEELQQRVFGYIRDGAILGAWGSERPDAPGSLLVPSEGAFRFTGTKAYATNATIADYALVVAPLDGAGDMYASAQSFLVRASDPGVTVVEEWWEPALGMRATLSHMVKFENCFVPKEDLIGRPGEYLTGNYQIRSLCAFASNFLGTIEAMFDEVRQAMVKRKRTEEPSVIRRMALLRQSIGVLDGLMERSGRAYREKNPDMRLLSNLYRWTAGEALVQAIDHATALYGSTTMFRENLLAKMILDALMYVRHESNDRLMDTVGRGALNLEADYNFSGFKWMSELAPA